jgi:ABC-type antimicrobial peptide transport system permease subunit
MLSNILLSAVDSDPSMIFFDDEKNFDEFRQKLMVVDLLNTVSSIICFSLGAFMLMTTIGANIKDSLWDLGVLRSMGSTKEQITRILCFEMISNTLSAMTLGYGSGILVSLLSIAQFYILVELPLSITFPKRNMLIVGVGAILSMIIGAKYGTSAFQRKNISSILKGT